MVLPFVLLVQAFESVEQSVTSIVSKINRKTNKRFITNKKTLQELFGIVLVLFCKTKADDWPSCIVAGIDYTGDNIISGLRFSNEECALWCQRVGCFFDRELH